MAAPKKVGARWQHRVKVNGKRVSGTFDTKAAALAWEAGQRVAKTGPSAVVKKTCADAFEKYEIEVPKKKRGYRWEALRLAALAKTTLGAVQLGDLDASHIAAALYFMRPPAEVEVINDVNGELVNLYRVVKNHLEEFVRQFKYALSSRDVFKWLQQTPPHTLTDIQRAARFFYLQQQAFGGKVEGQTWGTATTAPPVNLLRIEENLSAAHLRLTGAYIENLDWYECMEWYDRPHTLFYLDPPYWETAGYGVDFNFGQYEKMAELMARLKGKAILSLNDHPDIRRVFAQFQMDVTGINYNVGGGGKAVERNELIIYSWDRMAEPAGLF